MTAPQYLRYIALILVSLVISVPAWAAQKTPEVKIVDKTKVYHPSTIKKGAKFEKPAVLLTSTVFDSIKEWKEIKKKKLTTKDAEYHLLLAAANKKFHKALRKVQRDGKYDIIAETGAITCKNCTAADVTQTTVAALPSD